MSSLVLRAARRDDVADIVRLLADDELGRHREQQGVGPAYWSAFAAIAADPRQLLVVAVRGPMVCGTLQITYIPSLTYQGGERAQIEAVRVAAPLRGQGIGREMVGWAVQQARERGCRLVQLTTDRARPGARRFYESLGFSASHDGMKLGL